LDLSFNQLTGEIPESICDLNIDWSNTYVFNISDNQFCPPYPTCIEEYVGYQDLSNCEGFVELWGEWYSIENTDSLDLNNSGLTGEIPPEIWNLTNLDYLDLGDNELTDSIPAEIGDLTNLTYLNLSWNQLTDTIPPEIGNLTNLGFLFLSNNQLTGEIPESICEFNINWSDDTYFNISDNQLCSPYPTCIEDYVGEQDPQPSNCDDLVELWGEIYSIEYTTELYLRSNELTGPILPEIENLTNLIYLDLSDNELTGSILPEIGNLANLTDLRLDWNQLSGSIPSEIGNLTNLDFLFLSNNQLTGEIPENICDLNISWNNDDTFDIFNNQLCPPYPSCIEDYMGYQDTSNCEQVSIIDETLPIAYNLHNAYPNPFNPTTTLRYDIPEDGFVHITIYDMMGRVVSNLVSSQQNAGYKSIQWNATNSIGQPVSAGLYLYTIQAGDFRQTKKMVLLK